MTTTQTEAWLVAKGEMWAETDDTLAALAQRDHRRREHEKREAAKRRESLKRHRRNGR